jgi:hypothetical protein
MMWILLALARAVVLSPPITIAVCFFRALAGD